MPPARPAAAPSVSQTRIGKVTSITGQTLNGASASADTAPATNAISTRLRPQASTIEWAKRVMSRLLRALGGGGACARGRRGIGARATRIARRTDGAHHSGLGARAQLPAAVDLELLDAARVGVEHLELEA